MNKVVVMIILMLWFILPPILRSELVCPSPAGCPIDLKTGECSLCVLKETVLVEKPDVPSRPSPKKNTQNVRYNSRGEKWNGKCVWKMVVGPKDDDFLPPNCIWSDEV